MSVDQRASDVDDLSETIMKWRFQPCNSGDRGWENVRDPWSEKQEVIGVIQGIAKDQCESMRSVWYQTWLLINALSIKKGKSLFSSVQWLQKILKMWSMRKKITDSERFCKECDVTDPLCDGRCVPLWFRNNSASHTQSYRALKMHKLVFFPLIQTCRISWSLPSWYKKQLSLLTHSKFKALKCHFFCPFIPQFSGIIFSLI